MSIDFCSQCGRFKPIATRGEQGVLCHICYNKGRKAVCSSCGKLKQAATSTKSTHVLCYVCYQKLHQEICGTCGKMRTVSTRDNGVAICGNCRADVKRECCGFCNQLKRVNARLDGVPICCACYVLLDPKQFFRTYKNSAKSRKFDFCLSLKDFLSIVELPCDYCGKYNRLGKMSGIDRIDNTIGYIKDNIVPCCFECNRMKGIMTRKQFLAHVGYIGTHCGVLV